MAGSDQSWWKEYRRKRLKFHPVSTELIIRKSLMDVAKEYMSHSSLACVHQLGDASVPPRRRIILLALFCSMVGMTGYFIMYTLSNTLTKPLIVTMESSTYPISDIDFPAVAICNVNRISKKTSRAYAARIYPYVALHNESLKEVEWWIHQYGRLLDFTWNESLSTHPFMDIRSKYHVKSDQIYKWMKQFAPDCNEMLLACYWGGDLYNCSDLFSVRRTFRGHCCVFNYVLDFNSGGKPQNTIAQVRRQVEPGPLGGLLLFVDPLVEDYEYPIHNIQGFDVFLFDPAVYPDPHVGRVIHRMLEAKKSMFMELMSTKQIATNEVRKYPWATRNCIFHDENPNYRNMYSYSGCLIRCKIKTVQSLCKCTPYFLPADIDSTELCTMEQLSCLNKYKEKLLNIFPQTENTEGLEVEMQDSLYCPECLPDCEFTKHSTRVSKIPLCLEEFPIKNKHAISTSNRNNNTGFLAIYQSTPDGVLDRLDVVSYWFEVLSNFGGFAGVVIGFSIISVIEIIYFFCIRLFHQCYFNYKRYC